MDQQTQAGDAGEALSPALEAMKLAMRKAEEAAEARRLAKQSERAGASLPDHEMLAELALIEEPVNLDEKPFISYSLSEPQELESLIAQAAAIVPERFGEERDGDLVVMRHETPLTPWYEEAAEAALPAALRGVAGPVDVKTLLQALLVEIGDVKRTNALLMEMVTRVDEKVERISRNLKERRLP